METLHPKALVLAPVSCGLWFSSLCLLPGLSASFSLFFFLHSLPLFSLAPSLLHQEAVKIALAWAECFLFRWYVASASAAAICPSCLFVSDTEGCGQKAHPPWPLAGEGRDQDTDAHGHTHSCHDQVSALPEPRRSRVLPVSMSGTVFKAKVASCGADISGPAWFRAQKKCPE